MSYPSYDGPVLRRALEKLRKNIDQILKEAEEGLDSVEGTKLPEQCLREIRTLAKFMKKDVAKAFEDADASA